MEYHILNRPSICQSAAPANRFACAALALAALCAGGATTARAQGAAPAPGSDLRLDAPTRGAVLDGVLARVRETYVFPALVPEIERSLRARQRAGAYDRITSGRALADTLTAHLRAASRDKHMGVWFSAEPVPERQGAVQPDTGEMRAFSRFVNAGFSRVERLPGNIGYVKLDGFVPPDHAREAAAAAMRFVAGTGALILDLRDNQGGKPEGVAQFLGWFAAAGKRTHVSSIYWREGDSTQQHWTSPEAVDAPYPAERAVFVLTSARTFSAGEETAYDLQSWKRATVIGEVTAGGANPSRLLRAHAHFLVGVPNRRAISPVTQTNWEGVGVKPDVAVRAEDALAEAHRRALAAVRPAAAPWMGEEIDEALRELAGGDEAEILALEQETAAAWNRADLDAHVAAYADSAVFMALGPVVGREKIRASLARGFWRTGRPVQQLRYEDITLRRMGKDHALMSGRYVLHGGGGAERTGWFTLVWERTAAGWRIVHDHSS